MLHYVKSQTQTDILSHATAGQKLKITCGDSSPYHFSSNIDDISFQTPSSSNKQFPSTITTLCLKRERKLRFYLCIMDYNFHEGKTYRLLQLVSKEPIPLICKGNKTIGLMEYRSQSKIQGIQDSNRGLYSTILQHQIYKGFLFFF